MFIVYHSFLIGSQDSRWQLLPNMSLSEGRCQEKGRDMRVACNFWKSLITPITEVLRRSVFPCLFVNLNEQTPTVHSWRHEKTTRAAWQCRACWVHYGSRGAWESKTFSDTAIWLSGYYILETKQQNISHYLCRGPLAFHEIQCGKSVNTTLARGKEILLGFIGMKMNK